MKIGKSPHWVENPCQHKRLELLEKHHYITNGHRYKLWRSEFIGFYKCLDCNNTGELDSWGLKYDWHD